MRRHRHHFIGLALLVLLIGAYAAAGFLAVPHYARRVLVEFVHQHYGRALTVGEIGFNPFTFALEVKGFSFPDADGQPLLAFARLRVRVQLASLWRLGPSFGEILLERPYARVVIRPDGELNLADLGKGFPPPPQPPPPSRPLRLYIKRLAVISGATAFEDRTRAFHAEFKPIAFELRDFSTSTGTGNDYTLNAASPEGERLIWSGTVRLTPVSSRGQFEIADLKARTLWQYLRESLHFEITTGVIGLKGSYELAADGGGAPALRLQVASTAVTDLGVRPNGATEDSIDLTRLEVSDTRLDLQKHSVGIGRVLLSGGDIRVWLNEAGRLNLLDLIAPAAPGAATASAGTPPEASSSPAPAAEPGSAAAGGGAPAWSVSVPDIAVERLRVSAEDRQVRPAAALALDPLSVHVTGYNTSPETRVDIALDSGVNISGRISARAQAGVTSGAVSAQIEATDLPLAGLQPYLARYTSMTLLRGTLGARLDIERAADGALALKGKTRVADLSTVDNALKQDFVKWKELVIEDLSYRSHPASLALGSVTALEPYVRMIIAPDRTVNVVEILKAPGARPGAPAAAPPPSDNPPPASDPSPGPVKTAAEASSPTKARHTRTASGRGAAPPGAPVATVPTPFAISIGKVRFVNASANYSDLWIKPSFAVGIQTLEGTVSGLSSDPKSRARVELNGKVDRYSPVNISGEINLLSAALYTDVTMGFKDLDLTVVNPYSSHFAGYRIDKGKLSVDVSYKIEQRRLAAEQHFVVDQLELGERVEGPDVTHLPLKIAVALLKDRNGVIDLNLPMGGSLDDPSFRIGPVIWKVFVNLITKAATAPFALLGHLFGGGEHMNIIEFAGGSAELDRDAKQQLASLVKALTERPQLKLDVPIVYSAAIDRPQLAAARLLASLRARAASMPQGRKQPESAVELALADPQRHFRLLVEEFQAQLGKQAPLPPSATAAQAANGREAPAYDPAIADLDAALIDHIQVTDADLTALGKQRAQAIQDALLSGGGVDAARVFIVNAPPQAAGGEKVRVELAVR